jgi:hypothetical protein
VKQLRVFPNWNTRTKVNSVARRKANWIRRSSGSLAILAAMLLSAFFVPSSYAQNLCTTGGDSGKVACTVANVYGPGGLSTNGQALVQHNFFGTQPTSFFLNLTALNSAVGGQLGQLPLVSPASGIAFAFSKSLGVFVPQDYNFGSVLSERSGTIGRHKFLVGFSYQRFDFDTLDGLALKNLPAAFAQNDVGNCSASSEATATGGCAFIRDVIVSTTNINLQVNQYTSFMSFGITDRFDVSVAVPVINVGMTVTSATTVHNNGSDNNIQYIDPATGQGCLPNPCFGRTFSSHNGATGIGDLTFRAKYTLWKGEKAGFAIGGDLRVPTGDALNYLGAGAVGVKVFGAWSRSGRIAPHLNVGYEWNGNSYLAGNITPTTVNGVTPTATKDNLPAQMLYSAGVEIGIFRRLSLGLDYLGNYYFNAPRIASSSFQELPACAVPPPPGQTGLSACNAFQATGAVDPTFQQTKGSFNTSNASVGLRFRPFGKFLLTGNVVIKLDDPGLRSKFIPLAGISFSH